MNESDVAEALSRHFCPPVWAFLPQVRNGTGWAKAVPRTADALAMCLWPSRGIALHGIEIKVSRSDWLAELKDPEKAEDFFRVCNHWWIAVPEGDVIVRDGELPKTWGLLVCGAKVGVAIKAPPLNPKPMDNLMLAAVMRRLQECKAPQSAIDAALAAGREEGRRAQRADDERTMAERYDEAQRLGARIRDFEKASGVNIDTWGDRGAEKIGEAVKIVLDGGDDILVKMRFLRSMTANILKSLDDTLEKAAKRQEEAKA